MPWHTLPWSSALHERCIGPQVEVGEVHLSRRRAGRRTHDTGYYMPAHILKLGR
jgi:hypothetical protein